MKKSLYLVQVNAAFESSMYLPYAAGTLMACAMNHPELRDQYQFHEILYRRTDPDLVVQTLDQPFVMAFSNYVWNFEYNKALAQKVKSAFPQCCIVFGGHNIPVGTQTLKDLPYVDVLLFGEGERSFCELLLHLASGEPMDTVPNIAFRRDNLPVCTESVLYSDIDFPSPYAMGVFDSIVQSSSICFSAILETNRGCPYDCAFCDWGMLKSKMRAFPIQRVQGDLQWMADHKIEYCYCADSNFGIFKRDMEIIDYVIGLKERFGYPQKFRVNYLKNSDDVVFEINQRLMKKDMSRGVTLSFQSLCPQTLEIIGRKNISIAQFQQLLARYQSAGIAAYSELILGLPGETYDSFCNGLEMLLQAGQHSSIFIYNCELLVNSKMGDPSFREKYEIETVSVPFSQDHFAPTKSQIQEYSNIIVSTKSMDRQAWIRTASMSVFLQALHCLGLTQCVAIYMFQTYRIPYLSFYQRLISFLKTDDHICGDIYRSTVDTIRRFAAGQGKWSVVDPRFGQVSWPVEEGAFLQFVSVCDDFYALVSDFLCKHFYNMVPESLLRYQKFILRKPFCEEKAESFSCDWFSYFDKVYRGQPDPLQHRMISYIKADKSYPDLQTYAKEVVWFGRRSGKLLSSDVSCLE